MANWDPRSTAAAAAAASAGTQADVRDAGLRSYMLSVYNTMASGVLLTGIVALLFAMSGQTGVLFGQRGPSLLGWAVVLAPLGIALTFSFALERISTTAAQALFWTYTVLTGLSLSVIFLAYTQTSVAMAFFSTAAAFAGLSLWGYSTKRDLAPLGTFLIMGLFGMIVAMALNALLIGSPSLDLAISAIGVFVFAGLTAYHTQRTKSQYFAYAGTPMAGKMAILSALQLYLDFINMFLFLLRFMGDRR
jgi:uncharacterized protein